MSDRPIPRNSTYSLAGAVATIYQHCLPDPISGCMPYDGPEKVGRHLADDVMYVANGLTLSARQTVTRLCNTPRCMNGQCLSVDQL